MTGLWLGFSSVLLTASSHGNYSESALHSSPRASLPNNFPKASLPSNHTSGVRLSRGKVKLAQQVSLWYPCFHGFNFMTDKRLFL